MKSKEWAYGLAGAIVGMTIFSIIGYYIGRDIIKETGCQPNVTGICKTSMFFGLGIGAPLGAYLFKKWME